MSCIFENTLHYSSPGHGDWGVVRIGMLAPESIQLFVCPSACGRHGAIGAMKQGLKDRLHYLYVSQSDIIDGYDDLIPDAVGEVLDAIDARPRVIFIFVSCLDDLIGTDHEALLETLGTRFPGIAFRVAHMNPISLGSKTPPPVSIQNNLLSLLDAPQIKDSGINAVGNLEVIAESSELYDYLKLLGHDKLRHISQYKTFDDFQEMSQSAADIVIGPSGLQAAVQTGERLGIPEIFLPVSYDIAEIRDNYARLRDFLNKIAEGTAGAGMDAAGCAGAGSKGPANSDDTGDRPDTAYDNANAGSAGRLDIDSVAERADMGIEGHARAAAGTDAAERAGTGIDTDAAIAKLLSGREEMALAAIKSAKDKCGDIPIIIDASATAQPFGLAKALITYGFRVMRVEAQECAAFDEAHLSWLRENHPEVAIFQPEHHSAVLFDRRCPDSLAVGVEGAYLAGSRHVADLFADGGMFGFDGIVRLMGILSDAMREETDLEALINDYGLVV